jgi:hypothetical protein
MSNRVMRSHVALTLMVLASTGCALTHKPLRQGTTPFEANDPAALAQAARGVVHRGFTADMVERALGTPEKIRAHARGTSLAATWVYVNSGGGSTHIVFDHDRVADILHVQ